MVLLHLENQVVDQKVVLALVPRSNDPAVDKKVVLAPKAKQAEEEALMVFLGLEEVQA